MLYCELEDIEKQVSTATLIQLTNDDSVQDCINSLVCDEAILYSSTLIDGYLRGKYSLPLNTHFPLLRVIAIDLSIYRLYSRRIYLDIPEAITENYKNAIKSLEQLKKGIISLETEEDEEVHSNGEYITNKTKNDRMFNKVRLSEY